MDKKIDFSNLDFSMSPPKIRVWPIVFVAGFYGHSDLLKEDHIAILEDFLMASDVSLINVDFESWPKDLSVQIFEALKLTVSKNIQGVEHVADFLRDYFEKLKGSNFWPERWSDSIKNILIPPKDGKKDRADLEYVYARGIAVKDIKYVNHIEQIINFAWGTGVPCFIFRIYEDVSELKTLPVPHYKIPMFSVHDIDSSNIDLAAAEVQKILFDNMAGLKEYIKEVDHEQYNN
jgi:hypothetical protein